MNFTPNDLQNIEIKKTALGYSQEMVNQILDKIIEDYSLYIKENRELKERISVINGQLESFKNIEDILMNSLVTAQKTAEEVKKNAYDNADNILREAELKAQSIIHSASDDIVKIKREYEDLKSKMKGYRAKCISLLSSQLEMLKETEESKEE
ncbi:MAG: DivIVA domain-containing protein [Eubacteriales bacterium]|nr:DivIVA domain-containing protein [Eubacteriales bacterium]